MAGKSHRQVDNNGYLTILSTPVSSFGIFEYAAWQVGLEDGDPDRIVKVFRPESAITEPEAIASFQIVPLIDEHDLLSGFEDDEDTMSPEDKGIDGVMSNVKYAKPWLVADLKVFTRRMQRAIESGKVELSLGYTCDFIVKGGTFEGQPYEVMQINLRGNHIALVDAARVEGARVLDSKIAFDCLSFVRTKPNGKNTMNPKRTKKRGGVAMDNAVQQLQALIPALQEFLSQEASEPEHQESAVEGAAEGAATAQPAPGAEGAEGTEDEGEEGAAAVPPEGGDVAGILNEIKALLEKLAAATAPVGDEGEEANVGDEEEEEVEDSEEIEAGDENVEGVEGTAQDCEGNGSASKGPSSGVHSAADGKTRKGVSMDAARKSIYADMANKQKLYDRVSPVIGAFDHSLMSCEEMAVYAAKKLKLNAPKGMASVALDSHLSGIESVRKSQRETVSANVGDSAFGDFDPIDKYLNGDK